MSDIDDIKQEELNKFMWLIDSLVCSSFLSKEKFADSLKRAELSFPSNAWFNLVNYMLQAKDFLLTNPSHADIKLLCELKLKYAGSSCEKVVYKYIDNVVCGFHYSAPSRRCKCGAY
jgi:hypothetical protein